MPVKMGYNKNSGGSDDGQGSGFQYLHAKLVVGKGAGRAYFLDQMEEGFDAAGNKVDVYRSIKFNLEDLPKFPQLPADTTIPECQVVLDKDDKIVAIGPYNGSYKGKAIDLGPKTPDGSKPMSRTKMKNDKNKPGKQYPDSSFWCIYQITDHETDGGLFLGSTPYMFLKDKFYQREDDGMTGVKGDQERTNTHATRLMDWGEVHHLWNDDIEWPADGNVLPELLRRLQASGEEVLLIFRKGMVNEVQPVRAGIVRSVATFVDTDEEPVAAPKVSEPAVSAGQSDDTFGK